MSKQSRKPVVGRKKKLISDKAKKVLVNVRKKKTKVSSDNIMPALEACGVTIGHLSHQRLSFRWHTNLKSTVKNNVTHFHDLNTFLKAIPSEDRRNLKKGFDRLIKTGKPFSHKHHLHFADGAVHAVITTLCKTKANSKNSVVTVQDISSLTSHEADLREWKEKHELICSSAALIIYDYDVRSGNISWSGDYKREIGFTEEEMSTLEKWVNLIHPDDRAETFRLLEDSQAGLKPFDVHYRFRKKDNQYINIHDRGLFVGNAKGEAVRMLGMMDNISERIASEKKIKESEQRFRRLIEDLNIGVILYGPDGMVQIANRTAISLLGATEERLANSDIRKHNVKVFGENGNELSIDEYPLTRAIKTNKPIREVLVKLFRPEIDDTKWILVNAEPTLLQDEKKLLHVVVTFTDVTSRIKVEEELKESELRFRTLQQASYGGIGLHSQGVIMDCNQSLCDLTGYTYEELIGINGIMLIVPEHQGEVIEKIKTGYTKTYDVIGIRKDGSRYNLEIHGKNIPYQGGTIRVTEFRDITERKKAELHIQEQNAKLVAITEDLKIKNEQLQEFAQIVSHNLRAPVGNILSLLSLLDTAETEEEKDEYFNLLKESGTTTLTTLNELNDVLQIKQNKNIEKQHLIFEKVFDHVKKMLNSKIAQSGAVITTDFFEVPEIEYPNIYLESIMLNLLSNALKYSHPARMPEITFKSYKEGNAVYLSVSDNGLGLNMERYANHVFKLRKTFHKHAESKGIGLFMIKNQIVALGGDITISSQENVGSTFTIKF